MNESHRTEHDPDDIEVTTVNCDQCGHEMTPFNPVAHAHICRECMKDIQFGDRYTDTEADSHE